jgi:tripartite-type tricarboxylate transporter receptor subunit TctC
MKTSGMLSFGALALGIAVLAYQPAAQAADGYYKGKTIRFIVGFGPGGGYDAYSRMLAPRFAKELGATVVVVNVPGAGGMRALNRIAVMPDHGLVLHIVNGTGAAMQQLVNIKGAKYDLTKLKYLGIIHSSRWNFLVSPKSPYHSIADVIKANKVMAWGGSGKVSGMSDGAAFTCYAIGLKCKLVTGYKGSRKAALAVAQGEMDAMYVSETSAYKYHQAKSARVIATMHRKRSTLFPNIPTVFEQLPNLTKEQQWWIDLRATVESLGRILVAPPSTPKHQVDVLRAATHKILNDPDLIAEGNRRKRYINYIPASEAKKAVNKVLASLTDAEKAKIKKVVLGTY